MATTIISTDQTTTQFLADGDELVLLSGVTISASPLASGIETTTATQNRTTVVVAGDIFSDGAAVNLASDANGDGSGIGGHNVYITSTGSAGAFRGSGVTTQGSDNVVTNFGEILSFEGYQAGVENTGDDYALFNYGSIVGDYGVNLEKSPTQNSHASVWNEGVIQGTRHGIRSNIVQLDLVNAGVISAVNENIATFGVLVLGTPSNGESTVINSGTIMGNSSSIRIDKGNNTVINSGLLIGDVRLGSGDDTFDGRGGTVVGSVYGSGGSNTYIIDDPTILLLASQFAVDEVQTTVSWVLGENFDNLTLIDTGNTNGSGNDDANVITGNIGNNVLNGHGGIDTIYGGDGDDRLKGGDQNDELFGNAGDDNLRGQTGDDVLKTGSGHDELFGGSGDDTLFGGDGNDILKGGMGKDKLFGGAEEDVFLFTKGAQSKNDSTSDTIKDFELGIDTIDLTAVVAGTLTFIGGGAFSGTQGEVQVTVNGSGTSSVLVDTDGDGTADMKITVAGVSGLMEGDFLL
ncbi:MAG: calcium-binding protein [Rhodobacteraceae bacterium]|nr:calcium-binding protein [Paracoccaceae bacterium]